MINKILTKLATAVQGKIAADMAADPRKQAIGQIVIEAVDRQRKKLAAMDEYDRLFVNYRTRFDVLKVQAAYFNAQSEQWRSNHLALRDELENEQLELQALADHLCELKAIIDG